jgi:hypothetical protein
VRRCSDLISKNYEYKVAISFAREQRAIAESIARCIQEGGGGPVFYDKDEKAKLWGKDLYEHLADIYCNMAEYCIVISSKEYLEKEWTVHERKSAQARALQNKGQEYILPIDFDGTKLPGLLSTIGYLSFTHEGVRGICDAFLQKIGITRPTSSSLSATVPLVATNSPRAAITIDKSLLFVPVLRSSWGHKVSLTLTPDEQSDGPTLGNLRPGTGPIVVAYQQNVALCRVEANTHSTEGMLAQWELNLVVDRNSFQPDMEPGTSGISAEQFAEQRARRLLLNENPAKETGDMNEIMIEVLRRGQGLAKIVKSPFPELFRSFRESPLLFLESAWITAAMQLKLSGCVATINSLKLELNAGTLSVDFVGTRHRKYTNVEPHVIRVQGNCSLQG